MSESTLGWSRNVDQLAKDLAEELPNARVYNEDDHITIQMCGWAIVLMSNGRWFPEDTTGG